VLLLSGTRPRLATGEWIPLPITRRPAFGPILRTARTLRRLFAAGTIDLIQVSTPVAAAVVRVSAALAGRRRPRVVYLVHGFHFQTEFWRWRDAPWYLIERLLATMTDHYEVITRADEAVVARWKKSVTFVPGVGVDLDRVHFEGDRSQAEAELHLEPKQPRALFIGGLSKQKGIPLLAACAREAPDVQWLVVGDGPLESELEGITNVHTAGRRDSIAAPLAACDVLVSFSKREGLPVAVMEAAAAGLPVVAVPNRGTLELARAGVVTALVATKPDIIMHEVRRLAHVDRTPPRVYSEREDVAKMLTADLLGTR